MGGKPEPRCRAWRGLAGKRESSKKGKGKKRRKFPRLGGRRGTTRLQGQEEWGGAETASEDGGAESGEGKIGDRREGI